MAPKRELSIKLEECVHLQWSTNLHLKIKTLYEEFSNFWNQIRADATETETKPALNWVVKVNGDFQLRIVLSKKHEVFFVAKQLALGRNQNYTGLETRLLKILVDNAEIFSFTKLEIRRNNDDVLVQDERKRADGLTLEKNLVWSVFILTKKKFF